MTEEELADQVQDALAASHRQAARARLAAVEVSELTGTGRSARGEVSAVVDHRGLVQDVRLTAAAMELDPAELRTAVLATVADANADLRAQAVEATRSLTVDPRPLAEQTEVLDLAEQLLRGGR